MAPSSLWNWAVQPLTFRDAGMIWAGGEPIDFVKS
jgi:hypothetical protein